MTDIVGQLRRNAEQMAKTLEADKKRRAAAAGLNAAQKPSRRPGMKSTVVDEQGDVRCPKCGARNSFTVKRTGKAKVAGAMMGGVGIAVMPKRLKCNGCGANLKRS